MTQTNEAVGNPTPALAPTDALLRQQGRGGEQPLQQGQLRCC